MQRIHSKRCARRGPARVQHSVHSRRFADAWAEEHAEYAAVRCIDCDWVENADAAAVAAVAVAVAAQHDAGVQRTYDLPEH